MSETYHSACDESELLPSGVLTIRLTKKLQDRLKLKPHSDSGISTFTPPLEDLGPRYAHYKSTSGRSELIRNHGGYLPLCEAIPELREGEERSWTTLIS